MKDVTVIGLPELQRALEPRRYEKVVDEAVDTLGRFAEETIQRTVPVRTGELRDSVHYRPAQGFGELTATARYARPVEARRHFWRRGITQTESRLAAVLARAGEQIRRIWD